MCIGNNVSYYSAVFRLSLISLLLFIENIFSILVIKEVGGSLKYVNYQKLISHLISIFRWMKEINAFLDF